MPISQSPQNSSALFEEGYQDLEQVENNHYEDVIDCFPDINDGIIASDSEQLMEEHRKLREQQEEKEKQEKKNKSEKQRIHVMREILSTEQTYVDWLKILDQEFMKPLKASLERGSDALLAANEYQNMFMDIEVVVRVNQELLKSLKEFFRHNGLLNDGKQPEDNTKNLSLGDIFLKMTPYLKSYASYINKYEGIFKFIQEKKQNKKKFRKWLEKTESQPATLHQDLLSFMILPVQRIPRYNLLLRELISNMDEDQVDYNKLVKANNDIKDVATKVNERLKEQNAQERLVQLSTQNVFEGMTFELLHASRKFLHEGVLGYVTNNGIKYRNAFLFSDLLLTAIPIIASAQESESNTTSTTVENSEAIPPPPLIQTQKYRIRSAISFLSTPLVWVNDLADAFVLENAFQVVSDNKVWTFFARNADEKKEWIKKLNKAIELLKNLPNLQNATNAVLYAPPPTKSKLLSYLSPQALATMQPYDQNPHNLLTRLPTDDHGNKRASGDKKDMSVRKLLNVFHTKQKKKIELNQLTSSIESDDEDDAVDVAPQVQLKPWMEDCNHRLVEKQRHLQLVNIIEQEHKLLQPFLEQLKVDDFALIQNPLFGLKRATQQVDNMHRLSIENDLKEMYKNTEEDFNSFISAFKGNIVPSGSSNSPQDSSQKRKSRFFFL